MQKIKALPRNMHPDDKAKVMEAPNRQIRTAMLASWNRTVKKRRRSANQRANEAKAEISRQLQERDEQQIHE